MSGQANSEGNDEPISDLNTYQENTQQKSYGQILRLTAEVSARFLFSVYTQQQVMLTHESLCRYQ